MNPSSFAMPALAALLLLTVLTPASEAAISCSEILKDLQPCVNYLVSGSGKPPADCCAGALAIASAATTTADRQAACNCIKAAAKKINLNTQLAEALPAKCAINLTVPVSPTVNCSKVS